MLWSRPIERRGHRPIVDTRGSQGIGLDRTERDPRGPAEMPGVRSGLCHAADRLRNFTGNGELASLDSNLGLRLVAAICDDENLERNTHVMF
jgi:hypothetical protein